MGRKGLAICAATLALLGCADSRPTTYRVSGAVTGVVLQGVTVTLSGGSLGVSTLTDPNGNYLFSGLPNGEYTITASYPGYTFSPANLAVTVNGAGVTVPNLVSAWATLSVSGSISGAILGGVNVTLSQDGETMANTVSDANGNYLFTNVANGNYTVTPGLIGYAFTPSVVTLTVDGADLTGQDFTAAAVSITLFPTVNLTANPGTGAVTLIWSPVAGASSYSVHYSTTAGQEANGTAISGIKTTSTTVTGLTNGTTYYFLVNAADSTGQGPASAEASATPNTTQELLANSTWRFVVLSAGTNAGWQRGTLSVDGSGNVTFPTAVVGTYGGSTGYADNNGASSPQSGFMSQASPQLLIDSQGNVKDSATSPVFTGSLGPTNNNLIVLSAASGSTQSIAILTRHAADAVFYPGDSNATDGVNASNLIPCDFCGFGSNNSNDLAGPRKVIWDQVTSGPGTAVENYEEWGFAVGMIGQTPQIMYDTVAGGSQPMPYVTAYSNEPRPNLKETGFSVDSQGVVIETVQGTGTNPVFLLNNGLMSDDKTLVLGVGLVDDGSYDPTGFSGIGRYALRIYHQTCPNSYAVPDATGLNETISNLAGTYAFRKIVVGPGMSAVSAWGTLSVSSTGTLSFTTYADSTGTTTPPANIVLGMYDWGLTGFPLTASTVIDNYDATPGSTAGVDQFWGVLYAPADPSLHGKISYNQDMFIVTRTEPSGLSSFMIGVK